MRDWAALFRASGHRFPTGPGHIYRADVDGLRAIAVIPVLAFHAFPTVVPGGFVGVDIFFVISGFVITGMILGEIAAGRFTFSTFYARRARRLFPALLLVMAATWAAGWILLVPEEYAALGRYIAAGAGFAANILTYAEVGYFDTPAATKPLLHLWSLGVEEQFYFLFPALILLASRRAIVAAVGISAVIAISFILNVVTTPAAPSFAFYLPFTRLWEFAAGAALAFWPLGQSIPLRWREVASVAGLMLLITAMLFTPQNQFPGWWALLPVAGASLAIAGGPHSMISRHMLAARWMVFVGLVSYPLYLWHWPLLVFGRMVDQGQHPHTLAVVAIAASFVLASATYWLVERPIRRSAPSNILIPALTGAALMVAAFGAVTYRTNGFSSRFPAAARDLLAFRYDYTVPFRLGTCFIEHVGSFGRCTDEPTGPAASTILLWGDSHAAALYRGIKKQFGETSRIIQLTSTGCPPIMDYAAQHKPRCIETNAQVLQRVAIEKPDRVMLAAFWQSYDWQSIGRTVAALRDIGIKRIDIIGATPQWREPLPKALYAAFLADPLHRLPRRLAGNQDPNVAIIDRELALLARSLGVDYVSLLNILCDKGACLGLTGESVDSLVLYDTAHLTVAGAEFIASRIPP